eukprot:scaffold93722_cov50-Phaeocystis_antarctica.AAC.2
MAVTLGFDLPPKIATTTTGPIGQIARARAPECLGYGLVEVVPFPAFTGSLLWIRIMKAPTTFDPTQCEQLAPHRGLNTTGNNNQNRKSP